MIGGVKVKKTRKATIRGFILGIILTSLLMSTALGAPLKASINVVFDSVKIFINGEKQEVSNLIYRDITYVPLREISQIYEKEVVWDEPNRTVSIYNQETSQGPVYDRISQYMKEESIAAYSKYYELLDFQISNYQERQVDGNTEATFFYKMIHKNFDKDPDTVEYIKELKDSGHKHYKILYEEYLEPKVSNYEFKIIIDQDDNITLFSNVSPKGTLWEETKMTDYILVD